MKKKNIIVNLVVMVVLLAQINLPLFIHVCTMMQTVTFLSSCGMHEPKPVAHACCKKPAEEKQEKLAGHCEEIFAKEYSVNGTISPRTDHQLTYVDVLPFLPADAATLSSLPLARTFPNDSSPPESPPIFLLDSNFRI